MYISIPVNKPISKEHLKKVIDSISNNEMVICGYDLEAEEVFITEPTNINATRKTLADFNDQIPDYVLG